jgi:hypothetical protein
VFARCAGAELSRVSGNAVLTSPDETVRGLNEVGARVWELLDGMTPMSVLAAKLAQEHGAPSELVEADVAQFLSSLWQADLVELREGGAA